MDGIGSEGLCVNCFEHDGKRENHDGPIKVHESIVAGWLCDRCARYIYVRQKSGHLKFNPPVQFSDKIKGLKP